MPSIVKTTCPNVDITYHTYISHISQATTWTKIFHLSLYSLPTLGVALVDLARMTNLISIEAGASIQDLEFGTFLKKAPQRQHLGLWD